MIQANEAMKAKLKLIKSSDINERKKKKNINLTYRKEVNSIINPQFQESNTGDLIKFFNEINRIINNSALEVINRYSSLDNFPTRFNLEQ